MAKHNLSDAEEQMATYIERILGALLNGHLDAVGMCCVDKKGVPAFFFLNEPEAPILKPAIDSLSHLYANNQKFRARITAPKNNRSYRHH